MNHVTWHCSKYISAFSHPSSAATVQSHPKTGLCSEMPSQRQVARWCSASLHRARRNPGPGGMPQVSLMSMHLVNRPWIFGLTVAGRLQCQAAVTYQNTEHSLWVQAKWAKSVHFLFQQCFLLGHHPSLFISSHLYKIWLGNSMHSGCSSVLFLNGARLFFLRHKILSNQQSKKKDKKFCRKRI